MARTLLNDDLNIIANSNLEILPLEHDLAIIQKLDDEPNDVGGLTAQQLKAKFDESGLIIQTYINESLIPQLLESDSTEASRNAAEVLREEQELERQQAEDRRAQAEAQREENEQARAQAENQREETQELHAQAETQRVQAETRRAEAEQARIQAENQRVQAESKRSQALQQLEEAGEQWAQTEQQFTQAEAARASAETRRVQAETQRQANEQSRIDETNGVVAQASAQVELAKNWALEAQKAATGGLHASSHRKGGTDPLTPAMIGTYSREELDQRLWGRLPPQIIVTTAPYLTVTCTKGDITLTAEEADGTWIFDVPEYGELIVSDGIETAVLNVDCVKQYSVTLCIQIVNYTMLYDYGDECTDLTGGWVKGATIGTNYTAIKNETNLTIVSPGVGHSAVYTTNQAVSLSGYSKIIAVGTYSPPFIFDAANKKYLAWGDDVGYLFQVVTSKNERMLCANINTSDSKYISIHPSSGGSGVTNYVALAKPDDIASLCQYAGLSSQTDPDILVSDTESIAALFNHERALRYMVYSCTGDFMFAAIQSQVFLTALEASPYKELVYANEHWAKFLTMAA